MMLSRHRHALLIDGLEQRAAPLAASAHFQLYPLTAIAPTDELVIVHDFGATRIDNNLGYHVVSELLPLLAAHRHRVDSGYSEQDEFERSVGDIVRSMAGNERSAWRLFYANTLNATRSSAGLGRPPGPPNETANNFIGLFGAIYRYALHLIEALPAAASPPTVLDVATCFGFLRCRSKRCPILATAIARRLTASGCWRWGERSVAVANISSITAVGWSATGSPRGEAPIDRRALPDWTAALKPVAMYCQRVRRNPMLHASPGQLGSKISFKATVRGRWGVENQQHRVSGVQFREGARWARNDCSAENLALIRRMASNVLLHNGPPRNSIRRRKLRVALTNERDFPVPRLRRKLRSATSAMMEFPNLIKPTKGEAHEHYDYRH